jgi:hypothetical protein
LRILCVATKCPWPPSDGGRLVLSLTLQGFVDAGHDVTVVTPDDGTDPPPASIPPNLELLRVRVRPHSWIAAAARALRQHRAATLTRHDHAAIRAIVATRIARWTPDIVHAEQLQAMANCAPAAAAGIPIALRMQNVESNLWRQMTPTRFPRAFLRVESQRLRAGENLALAQAATTIALTPDDAQTLAELVRPDDRARIVCIEPAFPAQASPGAAVGGDPALVLSGSTWWPNAQGRHWFLRQVWPLLRAGLPGARLHVFGGNVPHAPGIELHAAPAQSQIAFPRDAIAIVPLLAAGGIRMRILEGWSRGLPVVATSIAARGLNVVDGRELLLADSPEQYLDAVRRVHCDVALRQTLAQASRAYLVSHHDPALQTQKLLAHYAWAIQSAR